MQTKRDQLNAHVFVVTRLVSALVRADPDQPERPMRRTATGGFIGLGLAVVTLVAFGVYGYKARSGNDDWRQANSIIVEQETGSRYVYLDAVLRPVLNYTSARLAAGGAQAQVRTASSASLRGVPHGRPIGIPGAPDQLPDPSALRRDPWLVCMTGGDPDTGHFAVSLGGGWASTDLPDSQAALVIDGDSHRYLVQHGQRLSIPNRAALLALGYGSATAIKVAPAWLNAFAVGPELSAPRIAHRGDAGPALDGRRSLVGQVLEVAVPGGTAEYYVVLDDGLLPITATMARLVLADPATAAAYPDGGAKQIPAGAAAVVLAKRSSTTLSAAGLPDVPPSLAPDLGATRSLCARLSFDAGRGVTVALTTVPAGAAGAGVRTDVSDARVADTVLVPPGAGALVVAQAGPGVPTGTTYLITDLGVKYPLPSSDVVTALGYQNVAAVPVPTTVLAMLPTGPALDPETARTEQVATR